VIVGLGGAFSAVCGNQVRQTGFPKKQMIQSADINFKNASLKIKRKLDRKISLGLWMIALLVAIFAYYRYLNNLTHVRMSAKSRHSAVAASTPATGTLKLAASQPKADDKPALAKTDNPAAAKAATGSFADSLMSVLSPSAKAETMQPEMQPAPRLAKRTAASVAAPTSSGQRPLLLSDEQKLLKVAEDGFYNVMNLAYQYPSSYGFTSDDNLGSASLGGPIPVYMIAQQDRESYARQPVASLLKPADEWLFPVILGNRICFMMQIRCVGHHYVLGQGSRALAMAYDKILARWPASHGFHPRLVINPDMPFYFFTIPELPEPNMTDTSRMLDFNPSLSPAAVILSSWR
jgi:hypothetical protein